MKKVILEVEDFDKIVKFITSRNVSILESEKSLEILKIINSAKMAEVEEPKKSALKGS